MRQWLLSLIEAGRSHSYVGQALSALRFLYVHVLDQPAPVMSLPRPKRKRQLPRVLAAPVVKRFLEALQTPKRRAIAFVLDSSGLRVGEVVRLKDLSRWRREVAGNMICFGRKSLADMPQAASLIIRRSRPQP